MPISGSTKALEYSRLNVMRLGASRLDYYQPTVKISINGSDRTKQTIFNGATITQLQDGTPDTATFQVTFRSGTAPAKGQEIKVALGLSDTAHYVFAGHIEAVRQMYPGHPGASRTVYDLTCIDYTWLLNRRKVTKRYTNQTATAIVLDLMGTFTSGFTTNNVEAGLATIDEITFTEEDVTDALDRLSKRIGGGWVLDYGKDLHFGVNIDTIQAGPITDSATRQARDIRPTTDLSQVRTRIKYEGEGSTALVDRAVGDTTIPLVSTTFALDAGGGLISGPQEITYTAKSAGGTGSTATGKPLSPGAPTAAVASGTSGNLVIGGRTYKVTFVTAIGESELGTASGSVTIANLSAADAAGVGVSQVANTAGNLTNAGARSYKVTYVTTAGETDNGGTASSGLTISHVTAPGALGVSVSSSAGNVAYGDYKYKVTYVDAGGETDAGTASSTASVTRITPPATAPSASGTTGGSLTTGNTYSYHVTYVDAAGETIDGSAGVSHTLSGGNTAISLTSIPTSSDGRVTKRKIYRVSTSGGTYFAGLITTINDNSTTSYTDTTADSTLKGETAPLSNTTGTGQVNLSSIPTSSDGRVTKRKIYRTESFGSVYKLLTTLNDNSTTTATDNTADSGLGDVGPDTNTSGTGQIALTSIPTGSDGRTTKRRLYRTVAGGTAYKLVTTINDNSTTSFTDNVADGSLGVDLPTLNTSGSGQINLTSIPLGPTGTTARNVWRTEAGGSDYRFVKRISDNSTTTVTDNVADSSLGDKAPSESHVGASAGDTVLRVADCSVFASSGGWLQASSQVLRFTGRSTSSGEGNLTGVPASGIGAIAAGIPYGASIVNAPFVSGIPASGAGSIQVAITAGDEVNLLVQVDDTTAQTAMAGYVGGDGIHEAYFQDNRVSATEATARANAQLTLAKDPLVTIEFETRDQTVRAGRSITIQRTAEGISGTFKVQSVTLNTLDGQDKKFPTRTVVASSRRLSFEALLRLIKAA
jgi:hypothetical protein